MSEHHKAFYTVEESEVGNLYYFAPLTRAAGPFKEQRHVEAVIDIDADGCLAGVELIDKMPAPPKVPPMTAPADSRIPDERLDRIIDAGETVLGSLLVGIATELRERRAQAVTVKPLEWEDVVAPTPFGTYTVSEDADDWQTIELRPEGVFDVLARWYDAGLNRFILCRFTGCVLEGLTIIWCSPLQGSNEAIDLERSGYRVVAWKPAPGPEDVPDWLEPFVTGPEDRKP